MASGGAGAWTRYFDEEVGDAEGFMSRENKSPSLLPGSTSAGAAVNVGTQLAQVA